MEIREVTFGSEGQMATLALRTRVLRDPLGLAWTAEERRAEPGDRHFGGWDGDELVACVLARESGDGRVKLRQMAVAPERQGTGAGRNLLERVEALLREEGARCFELHARETAQGFYERLGYETVGERFVEVGIPHWKMVKPAESGR